MYRTVLTKKLKPCLYLLLITLMSVLVMPLMAQKKELRLVNRKVLVYNFRNMQKNAAFEYLQVSIPEALVEKLKDTDQFELLGRNISNDLVTDTSNNFNSDDLFDQHKTVELARKYKADVVVIGYFVVLGDRLQMQASAVDVETGRLVVVRSKVGKTDGTMFGKIDEIAVEFAAEMKKKLPPVRQKVVVKNAGPGGISSEIGFEAVGTGLMGSLVYNLYLNSHIYISAAGGYLPAPDFTVFSGRIGGGYEISRVMFSLGTLAYYRDELSPGVYAGIGYHFIFSRVSIKPFAYYIFTTGGHLPWAGIEGTWHL